MKKFINDSKKIDSDYETCDKENNEFNQYLNNMFSNQDSYTESEYQNRIDEIRKSNKEDGSYKDRFYFIYFNNILDRLSEYLNVNDPNLDDNDY